ncbi:hypothetical protein A7A08_02182 [Methyloligella halotolerans]|uniref:Uncharacterized protein n=1 Tax=Methyloligella halotolerans TaxID=1177755 RepID=A0A1E2RXP8_9HYPH|nr:hypothetical protein [Methyloligella halotolerans]ODA66885.1 hypothetical protein A7A08_02182 [Methyloligella halotolerans]
MAEDEFTVLDPANISVHEAANAGVKNIEEIQIMGPTHDAEGKKALIIRFNNGGYFELSYSPEGKAVSYQFAGVRFERLGQELFISAADQEF